MQTSRAALLMLLAWSVDATASETLPGEPFAPGVVSTDAVEVGVTFEPDGRTAYFARYEGRWGRELGAGRLLVTHFDGHEWSAPRALPFSGEHSDSDPAMGSDARIYFISERAGGADIFVVARSADGTWGNPQRIDGAVNSTAREWSPVVANSGRLYFASDREGGLGQGDLYVAEPAGDGWGTPRNLGSALNTTQGEWNLTVDPDERFLIFEASGRAGNRSPAGDLWLSMRDATTNDWSPPVPLEPLNTEGSDLQPSISPDRQTLYFTSTRAADAKDADIYSVPLAPLLARASGGAGAGGKLLALSRAGHALHILAPDGRSIPVPTGRGPHELAVSLNARRAYVADYGIYPERRSDASDQIRFRSDRGGTVSVIDVDAEQRIATWQLDGCERPHGIAMSPDGASVWVTCEDTRSVLALDAATGDAVRRIELGREGPHMMRFNSDGRWLAVACVEAGGVALVDVSDAHVRWVPTGAGAEGLEFAPDDATLWVLNGADDAVSIVDAAAGEVVRSFVSGGGFPIRLQFDAARGHAWIANNQGRSITIFDVTTFELIDTVAVGEIVLGLLIVPEEDRAYVSLPRRGEVVGIDLETRRQVGKFPAGPEVDGLAWLSRVPSPQP